VRSLGGHCGDVGGRVGLNTPIAINRKSLPSLLTPSKTTNDLIGEAVGLRVEPTATGEMGQAAELTLNSRVKAADNQVIGIIGRDTR
jgi:hypothetical protein